MESTDVLYSAEGPIAVVTMNRPQYRNAQSYGLLQALDEAFDRAMADPAIKVVVLRGSGGHFSSGHDLGTPEGLLEREQRTYEPNTLEDYNAFRHYNLDVSLKWRNLPKPTIAMVEGYCIFAGWMLAASMDLVFAAENALFLVGLVEYSTVAWDIGVRRAKEICFESNFLTAAAAKEAGFVSRVFPVEELERETIAFASRVAENGAMTLRMAKASIHHAADIQGFSVAAQTAFSDFIVQSRYAGMPPAEGVAKRLGPVDLAVRGLRGQRPGQTPV